MVRFWTINYFYLSMTKYHNQKQLKGRRVYFDFQFQGDRDHGKGMAAEAVRRDSVLSRKVSRKWAKL